MSAWYIFSMMGFYPVNPCGDGYVLGAPQAEEIKLRVGSERACAFRIVHDNPVNPVPGNFYLNGRPLEGVKISHADIMSGGELRVSR